MDLLSKGIIYDVLIMTQNTIASFKAHNHLS